MKTLLTVIIISLALSSCSSTMLYGPNHKNAEKVKNLSLGMTKQEAIGIMGNDYDIESVSQEEDGLFEIIRYYSSVAPYLLHFLDGKLVLFEKYHPPYVPEQKVTVKHEKE